MLVYQRVSVVFHAYFTHTSQVLQAVGLLGPDGTSQRQRGIVVFINVWSRTWGSPSLRICPTFLSVEGWLWFYLSRVPIFLFYILEYLGIIAERLRQCDPKKTPVLHPQMMSSSHMRQCPLDSDSSCNTEQLVTCQLQVSPIERTRSFCRISSNQISNHLKIWLTWRHESLTKQLKWILSLWIPPYLLRKWDWDMMTGGVSCTFSGGDWIHRV